MQSKKYELKNGLQVKCSKLKPFIQTTWYMKTVSDNVDVTPQYKVEGTTRYIVYFGKQYT